MDDQNRLRTISVEPGELVYNSSSQPVGRVSGLTEEGFKAELLPSDESVMAELPGQAFGEGYIMWRCGDCGEMDEIDAGLPETCPNCSAPIEAITVVAED
jgi:rubrerythrin